MTEDEITVPENPIPNVNRSDTIPSPPTWFEQTTGGKVELAAEGNESPVGWIDNLKHHGVPGTVSVLFSKAGSWRANHIHAKDSHALYVVSGEVHYWECAPDDVPFPVGSPPSEIFRPRDMFFTPSKRAHAMYFPVDTVMVSMSDRSRTHEAHEADLFRVRVV